MSNGLCPTCRKPSATLHYVEGDWMCSVCTHHVQQAGCRLFEFGHENPVDAKGSTAHVRDIKDRRWHPKEHRQFYHSKELGKTYFFPK